MQWPWTSPPAPAPASPPQAEELPESALERLERLERQFLAMQTEWADTLDKVGRHFARAAARDRQRLHRDLGTMETAQDAPGEPNGSGEGVGTPHDRKAALRAAVNAARLRR